jgi:sugar-specific transcriptional regulator TrmB
MSENTQKLAEKIARILEAESQTADLSSIQNTIEKINQRLDSIENTLISSNPKSKIQNLKSLHPSQEKFAVAEAVADKIIDHLNSEKACQFEPNGKPCDHCSMCSSRGF